MGTREYAEAVNPMTLQGVPYVTPAAIRDTLLDNASVYTAM
jgi:hypothetical protein